MSKLHLIDHGYDRGCLTLSSPVVVSQEPIEAESLIVHLLLLGKKQGKSQLVGKSRPAAFVIEFAGSLRAAV